MLRSKALLNTVYSRLPTTPTPSASFQPFQIVCVQMLQVCIPPAMVMKCYLILYPVRQHGAIYSESGYALTLTHTHAIVWPYAVNIPSPETFTFELPNTSRYETDPLPLGSLVTASA